MQHLTPANIRWVRVCVGFQNYRVECQNTAEPSGHSEKVQIRRERQGHCVTVAISDKAKKQAQQRMLLFLSHLKMPRYADDTLTKSAYISLTTYYTQNFLQQLQQLGLITAIHPLPTTTSAALRVSGVEPISVVLGFGLAQGDIRPFHTDSHLRVTLEWFW